MARGLRIFQIGSKGPVPRGPFVALAPGDAVTSLQADIPGRVPEHARAAIAQRQMQERFVLSDTEFHQIEGLAATPSWSALLAVDAAQAQNWRSEMQAQKAKCVAIVPDYLALPIEAGKGVIWVLPGASSDDAPELLVRLSQSQGFRAEWPIALAALRLHTSLPEAFVLSGPLSPQEREALNELPVPVEQISTDVPELSALRAPARGFGVNLLIDEAARLGAMLKHIRRIALPVGLAAVAALAWAGQLWRDTQSANDTLALYADHNTKIVRQFFLPSGPLLDLRAQVSQVVAGGQSGAADDPDNANAALDPMPLMKEIALATSGAGATVTQLSFVAPQQSRQALSVSLAVELAGFAELDALLAVLQERGLAATLSQSSARPEGGVAAQLQVSWL